MEVMYWISIYMIVALASMLTYVTSSLLVLHRVNEPLATTIICGSTLLAFAVALGCTI